jgi:hypothetical protein
MRNALIRAASAALALAVIGSGSAWAQVDTLIYSFETGGAFSPDGFQPNGATPEKVAGTGNTVGANSMRLTAPAASTFVGSFTQNPLPAILTDPLTTDIKLDVTLPAQYAGADNNIGIVYFGYHDPDDIPGTGDETAFGTPFQVNPPSFQQLAGRAAGTYTLTIPLLEHFSGAAFNGPTLFNNPDPNADWDIGGFQITISKDGVADLDIYIDNVRTVTVPEPASLGCLAVGGVALLRRRR